MAALYLDVLNRPIDSSGQGTYSALLANGTTRAQVATMLLTSTEYYTGLVQGFYQRFLHRAADTMGLNAYVTQLSTPPSPTTSFIVGGATTSSQPIRDEDIIAALVGSQEYFNLVTG